MNTNKTNAALINTTTNQNSTVECLESRTMMSVSGNIDSQNVMNIHATAGSDSLHVEFTTKAVKIYDTHAHSYGKGAPLLVQWSIKGTAAVRIYGDVGNDIISLGGYAARPVHTYGGLGHDTLVGGDGQDNLFGGAGNDYLQGNGGNDYLYGENGADMLIGDGPKASVGADFMSGGKGTDQVTYWYSKSAVYINMNNQYTNGVANEGDCIYIDVENVAGSDFDDVIYGNALNNTIWGRGGNDSIHGMTGNDSIYGQAGNDSLRGGSGVDLLVGGAGSDKFHAGNDDGIDTLWGDDQNIFTDGGTDIDQAYLGKVGNTWDKIAGGIEKVFVA